MINNMNDMFSEVSETHREYEDSPWINLYKTAGCYTGLYSRFDSTKFDADDFFKSRKSYDKFELYDSGKTYTNDVIIDDRKYQTTLYTLKDNVADKVLHYVAYEELFDDEYVNRLKPYCRCYVHKLPWYTINKYFYCKCCYGCLKSDRQEKYVIRETRDYILDNNINIST